MLSELALLIRSNGCAVKCSFDWPDHMSFLSFVGYNDGIVYRYHRWLRMPIIYFGYVKAGFVSIGVGHDLMCSWCFDCICLMGGIDLLHLLA
jgi:hypothetical protein